MRKNILYSFVTLFGVSCINNRVDVFSSPIYKQEEEENWMELITLMQWLLVKK